MFANLGLDKGANISLNGLTVSLSKKSDGFLKSGLEPLFFNI
jgi:hypothetical protein